MGTLNQIGGLEALLPTAFVIGIAVKATVLVLVAGVLSLPLARSSAAARHMVWAAAIGGVLFLPFLATATPWTWEVWPTMQRSASAVSGSIDPDPAIGVRSTERARSTQVESTQPSTPVSARETASLREATVSPTLETQPASPIAEQAAWSLGPLGLGATIWFGVAALLLVHALVGRFALAADARGARPVEDSYALQIMASRSSEVGALRPVRLLRTSRVTMPLTWGVRRPVILLPEASKEWSRERTRLVLEHELAHVWRLDALSHAVARVVCALYWFNPLVWLAAARLRSESERAADDWVLRQGTKPSAYAGHLLDMATHLGTRWVPAGALPMAHRSQLEGRVVAILKPSMNRRRMGGLGAVTLTAFVAGLVTLLTVVVPAQASEEGTVASEPPVTPVAVSFDAPELTAVVLEVAEHVPEAAEHVSAVTAPIMVDEVAYVAVPGEAIAPMDQVAGEAEQEMDPRSVKALSRALLNDESPEVRRTAAWALGEIEDREATPALSRALRTDAVADVRRMSAWAMGEIEDPASVEALSDALDDPDNEVREMVLWAFGEIESEAAVPALADALLDSDVAIRRKAAWALGEIESERAVPALSDALYDADLEVREMVVWALGEIESEAAVPALADALLDSNVAIRRKAAWALGEIESERAVPALSDAVDDPDQEVREMVIWALGEIEAESAVPALADALLDSNIAIRRKAAWALGEIESPSAVDTLSDVVEMDADVEVRKQAAWALGEIEDARAVPALSYALGDEYAEVVRMAAWALGEIEDESAVPALVDALRHEDPEVRRMAAWALGEIEPRSAPRRLLEVALDGDRGLRLAALEALSETEDPAAVPVFVKALEDEDPEVRSKALHGLANIADEAAVRVIVQLLDDDDPEVREAAARALAGDKRSTSRRTRRRPSLEGQ